MLNKILCALVVISAAVPALAWSEHGQAEKDYFFKFTVKDARGQVEQFETTQAALSYDDAFDAASIKCAKHFRAGEKHLSEDRKLDIVDGCANPRS